VSPKNQDYNIYNTIKKNWKSGWKVRGIKRTALGQVAAYQQISQQSLHSLRSHHKKVIAVNAG